MDEEGNVELKELGGKPVSCALGTTPLEAWGQALIKLGLIDEVMYENGLKAVKAAREDALREAKEKMEGKTKASRKSDAGDDKGRMGSMSTTASAMEEDDAANSNDNGEAAVKQGEDSEREFPSDREKYLQEMVKILTRKLEEAVAEDGEAAVNLADARIAALGGPMLCNPFSHDSKSQQANWIGIAVRREKTRMGSTGNKKKVVGAADLLERNDTFYNPDIESLIEGLPGTEYCSAYVFQTQRSGGTAGASNRSWIHEAQLRQEKEALRRSKLAKDAQAKENIEKERSKKRQKQQKIRDEKKRQKLEEEEEKKKVRIEERLARLRTQVDERLFKEASFQREKVVTALARSLGKEYQKRRRAAEIVSGQSVVETKDEAQLVDEDGLSLVLSDSTRIYHEDVVRIWDFVSTFGSFFVERGYLTELPTLDSLQNAIDCLRNRSSRKLPREEALSTVKQLAIALCKPLAVSLTRVLFASLIALNPVLQKEFGAAFFNEISTGTDEDTDGLADKADVLLPVNDLTWREIARQSFIADALGELGLQRHEVAHLLRGYRSAGHPNSKEAQRLRKAESFCTSLVQQEMTRDRLATVDNNLKFRLRVPCSPAYKPDDYRFYLHVAHSLDEFAVTELRENLQKATELSKDSGADSSVLTSIDEMMGLLGDIHHPDHPTKPETKILKKVRRLLRNLVNKVAVEPAPEGNAEERWPWTRPNDEVPLSRERVGLVSTLSLSKEEYKKYTTVREDYMEDALRMKEEAEGEQGNDDDDDDDDDDDEDDEQNAEVVTNGEGGQATAMVTTDEKDAEVVTRLGKETPYDDYCADIPDAPELIRRCLAVLRTLAMTNAAEPFHYPVDPQLFPNYYDSVLRPMCLSEVGKRLQKAAKIAKEVEDTENVVEEAVVEFGRNIRLISQNCIVYANAGPMVIAAGMELVRVFERLFLDWVLAPQNLQPPLEQLDEDVCVDAHHTDDSATVLLCDGCEGKYNITRLKPPLREIPKGDWYCPRCISGRWWGDLDPRIGKTVFVNWKSGEEVECVVEKCSFRFSGEAGCKPSLMYALRSSSGGVEHLALEQLDELLEKQGEAVEPIRCLQAVAESPGYGFGVDHSLRQDLVPVLLHPRFSESAAQAAMSSSVFRDTIAASATLLIVEPNDMDSEEWLRLLVLLVMKCSSTEVLQNIISKMENDANESMAPKLEQLAKVTDVTEILPEIAPDKVAEDGTEVAVATPDDTLGDQKLHGTVTDSTPDDDAMIVDAGSVEVVEEMVTDETALPDISSSGLDTPAIVASAAVAEEPVRDPKAEALESKARRQKAIEDSFAAYTIKNQLKPAVASFEVDNVSMVVDATLSPKEAGLDFATLRCRRKTCDFCGLTDVALGLPLVRVPNAKEWNELIPHSARGRKTHLIAEIPTLSTGKVGTKLVSLKMRVEGEIVSEKETMFHDTPDVGMTDFPPRSEEGSQAYLLHSYDTGLPFITGSLSAHESCAVAVHKARKEQTMQQYKERRALFIEQEAGVTCGRCLQIGVDVQGRSYWKFQGEPLSLFVCWPPSQGSKWVRFSGSESVASVIAAMKNDPVRAGLKMYFPDAHRVAKEGTWTDLLLRRKFPNIALVLDSEEEVDPEAQSDQALITVEGGFDPYDEGEEVLVESPSGDTLWDATIVALSQKDVPDKKGSIVIDAYNVHYTGWSTRFVEWVAPNRVVEPSEHNRMLQQELQDEIAASRCGLPPFLNTLTAKDFLQVRDRARGSLPLSDFGKIASKGAPHSEERKLAMLKAALLAIEAAAPVGSVHNTSSGTWRSEYARQWRRMVKEAEGPGALTTLAIYLEDMISDGWRKESVGHLLSCLPQRWKAIGEASAAGLAIRITVLDRTIKFATLDRKRYSKKKRR